MGGAVLVDAGFLVALLSSRDGHHEWAAEQSARLPLPWRTCDAVVSETFHLLGPVGVPALVGLLRRGAVVLSFELGTELERVLALMEKYSNVPMSLADACLVRMTETLADPVVATTDSDFKIYRRHSRQAIAIVSPG